MELGQKTAAFQKSLALAAIWPMAGQIVLMAVPALQTFVSDEFLAAYWEVILVLLNFFIGVVVAWLQLLGVAVYRLIERGEAEPIDTHA
ncbi:hypothetical protein [Erythrobacter sp.]|uniref:hypothetical protein n=1 Tax=Erythrobacter sp. TaxID=1042 RepID=UPI002EC63CF5|nr:hypothetical protein [Erythrobacter sp.]